MLVSHSVKCSATEGRRSPVVLDFFIHNFVTFILLSSLVVMLILNRKLAVPSTKAVISFSEELRHVEAYLSLVQEDTARRIDIRYDLKAVDFMLPPLTLEPLMENSVKYGTGSDNSYIRISTEENAEGEIVICVEDSGSDTPPEMQDNKSTGVGIDNTRLRLSLQCSGELELKKKPGGGMAAVIRLPKIQEVKV